MEKQVLVCYGEHRRVISLDTSMDACLSEREALLVLCCREFSELIPDGVTLTLQVKSEDWRGLYIDYVESTVPNKSIFQLVVSQTVSMAWFCVRECAAHELL